MEFFFYVISNDDWTNKYQYGIIKIDKDNDKKQILVNNLFEYLEYSPSPHNYISIYRLEKNNSYKFYNNPIDIISIFGKQLDMAKTYKLNNDESISYQIMPNLFDINKYFINNNTNFINKDGLDCLKKIIINEFPILGINTIECNKLFIDDVNELCNNKVLEYKTKLKNEDEDIFNNIVSVINCE